MRSTNFVLTLLPWAIFTAWCVWGFPPPVDLPAHGAQLETLANLIKGDPVVSQNYQIQFPMGYGLPYWIFLPLAMLTNGAVAIRVALWITLLLFPISFLALARAFQRSERAVILVLPLAFNFSYWYGLLSGLFAQPLVLFTLATFKRALQRPNWKWLFWLNLLALATFLSHLVAFLVLLFLMAVLAVLHRPRLVSLRVLLLGVVFPVIVSIPKALSMSRRAVTSGPWPPTELGWAAHFNWFFRNYGPEGKLAAAGALLTTVLLLAVWVYRRNKQDRTAAWLFFSMIALYFLTPKTLSGIYLIHVRLAVFIALLALVIVDWESVPALARVLVVGLSVTSLAETAVFHWRFAREINGLAEIVHQSVPGKHAYLSLAGRQLLGSRIIYAEHLGQWMTAMRGGVGQNFFADAEHHPVRFRPGCDLPMSISDATPDQVSFFDTLLVFGEGLLPSQFSGWRETKSIRRWRLFKRQCAMTE